MCTIIPHIFVSKTTLGDFSGIVQHSNYTINGNVNFRFNGNSVFGVLTLSHLMSGAN